LKRGNGKLCKVEAMKQNRLNRLQHKIFKETLTPEKRRENQYQEHCCRDVLISLNVNVFF